MSSCRGCSHHIDSHAIWPAYSPWLACEVEDCTCGQYRGSPREWFEVLFGGFLLYVGVNVWLGVLHTIQFLLWLLSFLVIGSQRR